MHKLVFSNPLEDIRERFFPLFLLPPSTWYEFRITTFHTLGQNPCYPVHHSISGRSFTDRKGHSTPMESPKIDEGKRIANLSSDLLELKKAFMTRIESVEAALRESELASIEEQQKSDALRQEAEIKASTLEAQLEETEDLIRSKEFTMEQLEESLNAEIQDLEDPRTICIRAPRSWR